MGLLIFEVQDLNLTLMLSSLMLSLSAVGKKAWNILEKEVRSHRTALTPLTYHKHQEVLQHIMFSP